MTLEPNLCLIYFISVISHWPSVIDTGSSTYFNLIKNVKFVLQLIKGKILLKQWNL